ncbi:hypothetical protein BH09PAT1_BH09PAT1_3140 [soil metagenome]
MLQLTTMSPKECEIPTPEQPKPTIVAELLSQYGDAARKRARRLIDPLDDHSFLSTMGIGKLPAVDTVPEQKGYFSPKNANAHFNEAVAVAKDNSKTYEEEIDELTDRGIQLVLEIGESNQARIGANGLVVKQFGSDTPIYRYLKKPEMDPTTLVKKDVDNPISTASMDLLNIVIDDELFRISEELPVYSPEEQKLIISAAIGLAQAVIVSELEKTTYFKVSNRDEPGQSEKRNNNRKISIYDHILNYAFLRIAKKEELPAEFLDTMSDPNDIPDYFKIQKYLELQLPERKKDKKKKLKQVHLYTG